MKKILVVDDEPSIVTLLTFNLEKEGYQVRLSTVKWGLIWHYLKILTSLS